VGGTGDKDALPMRFVDDRLLLFRGDPAIRESMRWK
jgi:hypothetical protein